MVALLFNSPVILNFYSSGVLRRSVVKPLSGPCIQSTLEVTFQPGVGRRRWSTFTSTDPNALSDYLISTKFRALQYNSSYLEVTLTNTITGEQYFKIEYDTFFDKCDSWTVDKILRDLEVNRKVGSTEPVSAFVNQALSANLKKLLLYALRRRDWCLIEFSHLNYQPGYFYVTATPTQKDIIWLSPKHGRCLL